MLYFTPNIVALSTPWIVLIVVLAVVLVAVIALYIVGRKAEKKQAEQQKTMEENSQVVELLIIDKKKLKLKDAGLPSIVMENAPKIAKRAKVPIVKAKVGPRVMNLMADNAVYEQLLPNQKGKAKISGIYITSFKRTRGPIYEPPKKKKLFRRNK